METRLLIAGEQVAGEGPGLDVENPYTQTTLATVALPSAEQVDAAIAAARAAARGGPTRPRSSAASCCTRSPRGCGRAPTSWPSS
jgi:aminobutyraldehyde dehydrogenase